MKKTKFHSLLLATGLAAGFLLLAGRASAVPTIVNGSFEDPAYGTPGIYSGGGTGWTPTFMGPVAIVNGDVPDDNGDGRGATPFGSQYLGLDKRSRGFLGGDSQTVHDFMAGQTYDLTLYVADSDGGPNPVLEILFSDGSDTNYQETDYNVPFGGPYNGTIQFNKLDILFTAPVSGDITLSLYNISAYFGPNNSISIDNVSIAPAAVPEPSTWMFLLGGAGAAFMVSRRKRASA